jgi:rod shape determining protein RodA
LRANAKQSPRDRHVAATPRDDAVFMKKFLRIDFFLLLPVIVLVSISLVTLLSLNVAYFKSQLVSLVLAIVAFLIFSQINIAFFKQFKGSIYLLSVIFLLITLAIGIQSHGAVRWIGILGAQIQFSEILKPFLALVFAAFLSEQTTVEPKSFLSSLLFVLPIFFLVYFQPDLGSALLYLLVALFALLIDGFPYRWFVIYFCLSFF